MDRESNLERVVRVGFPGEVVLGQRPKRIKINFIEIQRKSLQAKCASRKELGIFKPRSSEGQDRGMA